MRYKFILACLILAVISLSLVSAACPSDMIAYWKFDSSSQLGKDYADGHDGTASGDAGFFSGEKVGGGSLDLTNTNTNNPTWISVPFSDDLKFGQTYTDFTIEAWIKPDALGLSAYKGIIGAWAGSGGISFALYNGDLIMWMGNSATTPIIKTKDSVSSIWQHVAITKSGNTYTFYINGVQQELKNCGGTLSGDKKSCDYSGAINYGSTTWQFEIGSDNTISPLADRFIGKIDEVALWKKALSAYEIEQHHNSGNGRDYCTATVPPATCPDSQVIMKISDTTNAHGALWNDANYNTKICYDEIFGSEYTGVNPHDCLSGNANKVVGLNAAGNAHAEVPSRTSYLTNVCYGDLSCEMKTDPTPCSSGFTNVVRLSAETNAHLENASYTNYPVKICCKPGLASVVSGAYWSNMINVKISLADVKDTVKLNVAGAGLSGNINYTIYKQCSGLGCIPAFFFGDKVIATVNSSYGYATWQAGKKNDGSFETGDYYFKAKVSGIEYNSYDTPVYGVLTVNAPERNSLPNAVIVKPDAESKWLAGTNINFNQASYDEDDDLLVRWNFDDGNITSLYNCMTSNCNTTHKYVSSGAKVIGLAAEEMLRGQKDYDYRRIFVYKEGINVFAVISSPDPTIGEKIYLGIVDFNANLSYVASCTVDVCPVIPAYGKSSGCYEVRNSTALLKCYDLDNSKIGAGTFNLWFNWTFDEGPSLYGSWIENYSKFVGFKRGFVLPREHEARLLVGYEKL